VGWHEGSEKWQKYSFFFFLRVHNARKKGKFPSQIILLCLFCFKSSLNTSLFFSFFKLATRIKLVLFFKDTCVRFQSC